MILEEIFRVDFLYTMTQRATEYEVRKTNLITMYYISQMQMLRITERWARLFLCLCAASHSRLKLLCCAVIISFDGYRGCCTLLCFRIVLLRIFKNWIQHAGRVTSHSRTLIQLTYTVLWWSSLILFAWAWYRGCIKQKRCHRTVCSSPMVKPIFLFVSWHLYGCRQSHLVDTGVWNCSNGCVWH